MTGQNLAIEKYMHKRGVDARSSPGAVIGEDRELVAADRPEAFLNDALARDDGSAGPGSVPGRVAQDSSNGRVGFVDIGRGSGNGGIEL